MPDNPANNPDKTQRVSQQEPAGFSGNPDGHHAEAVGLLTLNALRADKGADYQRSLGDQGEADRLAQLATEYRAAADALSVGLKGA